MRKIATCAIALALFGCTSTDDVIDNGTEGPDGASVDARAGDAADASSVDARATDAIAADASPADAAPLDGTLALDGSTKADVGADAIAEANQGTEAGPGNTQTDATASGEAGSAWTGACASCYGVTGCATGMLGFVCPTKCTEPPPTLTQGSSECTLAAATLWNGDEAYLFCCPLSNPGWLPPNNGPPDAGSGDALTPIDASGDDTQSEDAGCDAGTSQCSDNGVQTCGSNGQWSTAVACTDQACVSGTCVGVCAPNRTQCSDSGVQTCGSNGQWGTPWECATGACSGGACSGATIVGPSCEGGGSGLDTCGESLESCCTSLEVPGGSYYRTYDPLDAQLNPLVSPDGGPTGEADPATVSGFRLDKYLVTVGRFRQYVNYVTGSAGAPPANGSGMHTYLNGGLGLANSASSGSYETGWDATNWNVNIASGSGAEGTWIADIGGCPECGQLPYCTWTNTVGTQEDLPINCVNWYEAYAFCIWDGGFLPSEAEWEYAAAGGSQQREYPWGSTDPGNVNLYAIYACDYPSGPSSCAGMAKIASVGAAFLGADRWGQFDMGGDVGEWVLDWYAGYVDPCADCADVSAADFRVFRGGSWRSNLSSLLPPSRVYGAPSYRDIYVGFRCARTP